jgi:hypothetical protein
MTTIAIQVTIDGRVYAGELEEQLAPHSSAGPSLTVALSANGGHSAGTLERVPKPEKAPAPAPTSEVTPPTDHKELDRRVLDLVIAAGDPGILISEVASRVGVTKAVAQGSLRRLYSRGSVTFDYPRRPGVRGRAPRRFYPLAGKDAPAPTPPAGTRPDWLRMLDAWDE